MITFEEFKKVDLIIAKVKEVEEIPNADKLYKLKIDIGNNESRTIVAGIKKYYSPEELKERLIVFLKNLAPATIRGIESQGMLLASTNQTGEISLILPDKAVEPGSTIS